MHDALEALPAWAAHQQQLRELEELTSRWAARDLEEQRRQTQLVADHQQAVDAAVAAGQPVPEAPLQPVAVRSRTPELHQQHAQLLEAGRRLMTELQPQVVDRAQEREGQLLEEVRRTPVADLEPLRSEAQDLAVTLRAVLLDGASHRDTVAVGELVECALEPGSSVLFLPVPPPFIHVERPDAIPAGRVLLDRDPSPTREQVAARYRRAEGRQQSQTVSHRLDG
jgi:hypothetical protein